MILQPIAGPRCSTAPDSVQPRPTALRMAGLQPPQRRFVAAPAVHPALLVVTSRTTHFRI